MARREVETVVVGAGHAGLAASWALGQLGLEHVVLEEGRIGETWRADRWDSFRLNTPRWMSRLPGMPPAAAGRRDGYDTAPEFADALAEYARLRDLPVREQAGPATIAGAVDGRYLVCTAAETIAARNVVVATGFQRIVSRPALAAALPKALLQLDTATYKAPSGLPEGAVLVAGGGQSGCQIAEDLVRAGRRVVIATSMVGRIPRRYRGRDLLAWWVETGLYEQGRGDVDERSTRVRQPIVSGTEGGHTISLQSLARQGVTLTGRLTGVNGDEVGFDAATAEHVRFGDRTSAEYRRAVDEHIAKAAIDAEPAQPDPAEEHWPGLGSDAPRTLKLGRAGIGTVIWCTGMRPRLDVLGSLGAHSAETNSDGLTRRPGLYLIGSPWLSARKSGIIWGAAGDAERIARLITASRASAAFSG